MRKFFVDEFYDRLFVRNIRGLSSFFDRVVDAKIIDGVFGGLSLGYIEVGKLFNSFQNGTVRHYATYFIFGVSLMSLGLLFLLEVK